MATVKFRVRSKANKEVSIKVRFSVSRDLVLEAKTGFSINPNQWSASKGRPKPTDATNKKLASDLARLGNYLGDKYNEDQGTEKIVFDSDWLQNKIEACFNRVETSDRSLVVNHYEYIIDNASTRNIKGSTKIGLSSSRIKSYKNSKRILEEYQAVVKKQIHFVQLDRSFVDGFTTWLKETKKYSISHCNKQIVDLKGVAMDTAKYEIQINPYVKHIEGFTEDSKDRHIATLSFEELDRIRKVGLKRDALKNARKWILLGCEIGQRGEDLLKITFKDNVRFEGGVMNIDVVQDKGRGSKAITAPVMSPHVIDIVENKMPYSISDQKLNKYIKEVCKIAGIDEVIKGKKYDSKSNRKVLGNYPKYELISNHCFRRSFATNYYKKVPTPILMEITGHSRESTFLAYINQSRDKDTNANLYRKYWEEIHENKEPKMKVSKRA